MRSSPPPQTRRYCTNCKKMMIYKYQRMVGHSYCIGCGTSSLFSKRYAPKEVVK